MPYQVRPIPLAKRARRMPQTFFKMCMVPNPKDPAVLKTLRIVIYYAAVFSLPPPPDLLHCEPRFEGNNACKAQENCVGTEGGSP